MSLKCMLLSGMGVLMLSTLALGQERSSAPAEKTDTPERTSERREGDAAKPSAEGDSSSRQREDGDGDKESAREKTRRKETPTSRDSGRTSERGDSRDSGPRTVGEPSMRMRTDGRGMGGGFGVTTGDPKLDEFQKADFELEHKTRALAERLRQGRQQRPGRDPAQAQGEKPDENRAVVLAELEKTIQEHFDVRQKRREYEIQRLEDQLEQLRKSTKNRADSRDAIIKKRLAELTGVKEEPEF